MTSKVEEFRNGMFLSSSRRCGETYMERIIRKYYGWKESSTINNDAINADGEFIEIKCSKVLVTLVKSTDLTESVILENKNFILNRLIKLDDCYDAIYDSNIQNIKRHKFDILIYVMLFEDCIKIFKCYSDDIPNIGRTDGKGSRWCGKHGGEDKKGKNGQFGIQKNNIEWHLDNKLIQTLTWEEAFKLSKGITI